MQPFHESIGPVLKTHDPPLHHEEHESHPAFLSFQNPCVAKSESYVQRHSIMHPHSTTEALQSVDQKLKSCGLITSPWDKKTLSVRWFSCIELMESYVLHGMPFAKEIDLVGVSDSPWQCQSMGLMLFLQCAHNHGILTLRTKVGLVQKALVNPNCCLLFVAQHCIPHEIWDVMPFPHVLYIDPHNAPAHHRPFLPCQSGDCKEFLNEYIWRNIISFANHSETTGERSRTMHNPHVPFRKCTVPIHVTANPPGCKRHVLCGAINEYHKGYSGGETKTH